MDWSSSSRKNGEKERRAKMYKEMTKKWIRSKFGAGAGPGDKKKNFGNN